MPGVLLKGCTELKEILEAMPDLPPHNWLITDLVCHDHCGWPGSEKWAEYELFLSPEELWKDISFRNPQIVFGVFTAIPKEISKEEALCGELPWSDGNSCYANDDLAPQHPKGIIEITPFDACYTFVIARDAELLKPFHHLSYPAEDAEEGNRKTNAQIRRIRDLLLEKAPVLQEDKLYSLQWKCWHHLYGGSRENVPEQAIIAWIDTHI